LENVLMGSVTEKVLHHTTIPLLIVPTKKSN
jgi:nucleotide-binding universal stress UspA family protein